MNKYLLLVHLFFFNYTFAQNLVKNIAQSDANSTFKNSIDLSTNPRNDSLMLVSAENLMYLFKSNPDTIIVNQNWNNGGNGKIRGVYKIKNFYVILSELQDRDYLVKISDNNPPILIWTSGNIQSGDDILNVFQLNDNLVFFERSENACNCSRIVRHTGEYEGGTVVQSFPYWNYLNNVTQIDNKIYFSTDNGSGTEPWVSDGTTSGTFQLGDLNHGTNSSYAANFIKSGNKVYFSGASSSNTYNLFETDGTQAGTVSIFASYNFSPANFIKVGDDFYGGSYAKIIKINIPSQTKTELLPDDLQLQKTFVINNKVYFLILAHNSTTNKRDIKLFETNGTTTTLVKILKTDLYFMSARFWQNTNRIFMEIENIYPDNINKNTIDLWVSDGTNNGTQLISELNPDISTTNVKGGIGLMGNYLYFNAYDKNAGYELCKTDGTSANTKVAFNYNKKILGSSPNTFFEFNNKAYFMANDNQNGRELWSSDGTEAGTRQVFDWVKYHPILTYGSTEYSALDDFGILGNKLLYIDPSASKLMAYDANNQTHQLLKDFQSVYNNYTTYTDKRYNSLTKLNNLYLFAGDQYSIWKTDGTPGGTTSIYTFSDIYANPTNFIKVGNEIFFATERPKAIWRTDGSTVQAINYFPNNYIFVPYFKQFNIGNKAYYQIINSNTSQIELWEITSSNASIISNNIYNNTVISTTDALYFLATENGNTVMKKRDTNGNTNTVFNTNNYVSDFFTFQNKIFYSKIINSETWLYSTDGTIANEVAIKKVGDNSFMRKMKVNNNLFVFINSYFNYSINKNINEIWISDGSSTGTRKVFDISYNYVNEHNLSSTQESIVVGNKLYFSMTGGSNGEELWVMDFTCPNQISITTPQNTNARYTSSNQIQLTTSIKENVKTTLEASNAILINPGTEIKNTSVFKAEIKGCNN